MASNSRKDLFDELLEIAWQEDLYPEGDLSTLYTISATSEATLQVRSRNLGGVMSGSGFATRVYESLDRSVDVEFHYSDGEDFCPDSHLVTLSGKSRSLLTGERLFLNLLQRSISIASCTRQFVEAVKGTGCKILDTRKTTPALRALEKQAVKDGGGYNHRFNLSTAVLLKDNHLALAGGITKAIQSIRSQASHLLSIQIEVDSLEQLEEALSADIDLILLDNFSLEKLTEAVRICRGRAILEASGGISLEMARDIAQTGVDLLSVGAITHSPPLIDLGLDYVAG